MRRLLLSVIVLISLTIVGIDSSAETEEQTKQVQVTPENRITDEGNFLTIRDEKGETHLIKTFAVIRFDDGIKLEPGNIISTEKSETIISEDKTLFE